MEKPKIRLEQSVSKHNILGNVEIKLRDFYAKANLNLQSKLIESDRKDIKKLECCAEYVSDITKYMCEREKKFLKFHGYMKYQTEITEDIRSSLIDWMSSVSEKFNLRQETLFLATNVLDRYLSMEIVFKSRIQLLAVAVMLIAAKYEEIYPPHLRDLLRCSHRSFMKEEVSQMELKILKSIKFDLSIPSILQFIQRFGKLMNCTERTLNLAMYFSEIQLMDYEMLKYPPSLTAAACLYTAMANTKDEIVNWNDNVKRESKHSEKEVKQCAKQLIEVMKKFGERDRKSVV